MGTRASGKRCEHLSVGVAARRWGPCSPHKLGDRCLYLSKPQRPHQQVGCGWSLALGRGAVFRWGGLLKASSAEVLQQVKPMVSSRSFPGGRSWAHG